MLAIRTVLHPTDFSTNSETAFRVAGSLARDYGARLVVLHVDVPPIVLVGEGIGVPQPLAPREPLKEKLQQLKPRDPKVPVEHLLVEGDPVNEILRVVAETKSDVIVMGTHGRTGLVRLLMGSVAEQIVRKAPCPVVAVKTPNPATAPGTDAVSEAATTPTKVAKK